MSDRKSPSPPASTREAKLRIVARGRRRPRSVGVESPLWAEQAFLFEPELEAGVRRSFGNKLLSFAVIAGISASFWTGVGILINHLLR